MVKGPMRQTKKRRKQSKKHLKPGTNWHGTIVYKNLPRAGNYDGYCLVCHTFDNPTKDIATTAGRKTVFVCNRCGRIMRPFLS